MKKSIHYFLVLRGRKEARLDVGCKYGVRAHLAAMRNAGIGYSLKRRITTFGRPSVDIVVKEVA